MTCHSFPYLYFILGWYLCHSNRVITFLNCLHPEPDFSHWVKLLHCETCFICNKNVAIESQMVRPFLFTWLFLETIKSDSCSLERTQKREKEKEILWSQFSWETNMSASAVVWPNGDPNSLWTTKKALCHRQKS